MQSVNDDMDDLFRRAAEDYPLNTEGADWDKVMQQLHPEADIVQPEEKKRDYRLLWLLLLLLLGFFIGNYFGSHHANQSLTKRTNQPATKAIRTPGANAATATHPDNTNTDVANTEINNPVSSNDRNNNKLNNKEQATATTVTKNSSVPIFNSTNSDKQIQHPENGETESGKRSLKTEKQKPIRKKESFNVETSGLPVDATRYPAYADKPNKNARIKKRSTKENKTIANVKQPQEANRNLISKEKNSNDIAAIISPEPSAPSGQQKKEATADTTTASEAVKDTAASSAKEAAPLKPAIRKKRNTTGLSTRKLYYTIAFGPDVSFIKNQQVKKTGYGVGLTVGYKIHKNIAIEAGAFWDYKYYYTNGKYFNTSKLPYPNMKIIEAEGGCYMIEIPVNIKYDFGARKNHGWFASAGLSSYLMHKENYNYSYWRNNAVTQYYHEFKNSSKNWFSIMNLSVGYQKAIGKYTAIRIEPYLKLPLNGVGIGSLPIRSTGVYLGFTHSVH